MLRKQPQNWPCTLPMVNLRQELVDKFTMAMKMPQNEVLRRTVKAPNAHCKESKRPRSPCRRSELVRPNAWRSQPPLLGPKIVQWGVKSNTQGLKREVRVMIASATERIDTKRMGRNFGRSLPRLHRDLCHQFMKHRSVIESDGPPYK